MPDKIDKPSSGDFIDAIIKNIPGPVSKRELQAAGALLAAAVVVKHERKKRNK